MNTATRASVYAVVVGAVFLGVYYLATNVVLFPNYDAYATAWNPITAVIMVAIGLVAGVAWGSRLGVQFSLSLIAYKALPVLILGGIDSIPGAILAGLVVGAGENLAEVYLGPYVGGGIQTFFPYLLALLFLWFKPYGMFGKEIIDRV